MLIWRGLYLAIKIGVWLLNKQREHFVQVYVLLVRSILSHYTAITLQCIMYGRVQKKVNVMRRNYVRNYNL